MKRKIIRQGVQGSTIYLPHDWIKRKGITPGDEVTLTENRGTLVISSSIKKTTEITIDITDDNKNDLPNLLTHIYRTGIDRIIVKNTTPTTIAFIKKKVESTLLGFEITSLQEDTLTIEKISEPDETKYKTILLRIFFIIKESLSQFSQDLEDGTLNNLAVVETSTREQDKYILFCKRTIANEQANQDSLLEWELLTFLLHLQHAVFYTYQAIHEEKLTLQPGTMELMKTLQQNYQKLMDAYFKKDMSAIHYLNKNKNYHFQQCYALLRETKGGESILLGHFRELLRIVQISSSPILSLLLQQDLNAKEQETPK